MKSAIKKLIKEELKSMIIEKARMSSKFRKAMEALYDVEYEQQELRKKFVAEKNPAKKEAMKKDLIALHKRVKAVQADFNKALSTEPVGDMDESKDLKENAKLLRRGQGLVNRKSYDMFMTAGNQMAEDLEEEGFEDDDITDWFIALAKKAF